MSSPPVRTRDAGQNPLTDFGSRMESMHEQLRAIQSGEMGDLLALLRAVDHQIGLKNPADEELLGQAEAFACPEADKLRCATHYEEEAAARAEAALWLREHAWDAFVHDIAIMRDTTEKAVKKDYEAAVIGLLTLPRTTAQARGGWLPMARYRHVISKARSLDAEVLDEFDTKVSRIRATDRSAYIAAVQSAWKLLHEPTPQEKRRLQSGRVDTEYAENGTATMVVTGPSTAIAVLDAKLEGLAQAIRRRQTTPLGLPDDAEITDDRTVQELRFAFLTGAIPAGTTACMDAGMKVAIEEMKLHGLDVEQAAALIAERTANVDVSCPTDPGWLARHAKVIITVPFLSMLAAGADSGSAALPGTVNGAPIPAEAALRLAGQTKTLFRMLTDPVTGAPLDHCPESYTIPEAFRLLLATKWRTCTVPNCDRTAARAEIDHIVPYNQRHPAAGGQTVLDNLHPVCKHHHQLKTEGKLRVERNRETGAITWIFPGDRRYETVPAPQPIDAQQADDLIALIADQLNGDLIADTDLHPDAEFAAACAAGLAAAHEALDTEYLGHPGATADDRRPSTGYD